MFRRFLRSIVDDPTTKRGRIFDYSIQGLILLSLIAYSIETLPDNGPAVTAALEMIELVCIVAFTAEYLLRIYVAKNPFKYIFSFFGIIDLLAILPFYLVKALDLRSLRVFRVFRLFRVLKLVRYNKALKRFGIAAQIVKEEIVLFLLVAVILIFLVASGIYFFENEAQPETFKSIFHSLWWAVVTLTTVGYGDVYPITVGGKIFTFFVLIVGVGIVTIPAGLVASALQKAREIEDAADAEKEALKSDN